MMATRKEGKKKGVDTCASRVHASIYTYTYLPRVTTTNARPRTFHVVELNSPAVFCRTCHA